MALIFRKFDRNSKEDLKLLESICKCSGCDPVKKESAFIRTAVWQTSNKPENLLCEILEDFAFYLCIQCKDHIRCVFVVVKESEHGKGYGRSLVNRILMRMKNAGISTMTFRTNMDGSALGFWQKIGARIVDVVGNDYAMELKIKLDPEKNTNG